MTIAQQRQAVNDQFDVWADVYGETNTLTPAHQTEITDSVATILSSVNPNHTYPPVSK